MVSGRGGATGNNAKAPPPAPSFDLAETSWSPPDWALKPFRFEGQQRQLSFSGPAGTLSQAQVRWPGIERCWDGLLNRSLDGVYLKGGSEAVRDQLYATSGDLPQLCSATIAATRVSGRATGCRATRPAVEGCRFT